MNAFCIGTDFKMELLCVWHFIQYLWQNKKILKIGGKPKDFKIYI